VIVQVALPVHSVRCMVWTDDARDWSIVHEAVLLTLGPACLTLDALAQDLDLARQVVVAALARLMRHRLVEVAAAANLVFFGTSAAGAELAAGTGVLPRYPRESKRTFRIVVERYSGCAFQSRDVRLQTLADVNRLRSAGSDIKIVEVSTNIQSLRHEVTLETLADIVESGGHRRMLRVDDGTAIPRTDQYMLVNVVDGVPRLPPSARKPLAAIVTQTAAAIAPDVNVTPIASERLASRWEPYRSVECDFDPADVVLGGSAHGAAIRKLLAEASTRFILHSTFLEHEKFALLKDAMREACARGVRIDLLWGADDDDSGKGRNALAAEEIANDIAGDPVLRTAMKMRMRSTGSHAKVIIADTAAGEWVATLGSCNWLSSPFHALEASVILREPRVVADVISVLRETVGRRSIADALANELALAANDLRRNATQAGGPASVTVIFGGAHEAMMRRVSREAMGRLVICTHRVGGNVRPATILPATLAASRGVRVSMLYTQPNLPMTRQAMREVAAEAAEQDVEILMAKKVPAHAKVLLWTPDNVVVTSHNWGSASTNQSFPHAEVGVHIRAEGLADMLLERMSAVYPQLSEEPAG